MVEFVLVMSFYSAGGLALWSPPLPFPVEAECKSAGSKIQKAFEPKTQAAGFKWAGFICVKRTASRP